MKESVLLLKGEDTTSQISTSTYKATLGSLYDLTFIPIFEFQHFPDKCSFIHEKSVESVAIIITSPRSVESLSQFLQTNQNNLGILCNVTFFVVGKRTKQDLLNLLTAHAIRADIRGEESGNAIALAAFIKETQRFEKYIFLSGKKRSPVIERELEKFNLVTFIVYEAKPLPLEDVSKEYSYVVFFSPSGVTSTFTPSFLNTYLSTCLRAVAIGPSTFQALNSLEEQICIQVIEAAEPTPTGVKFALQAFEKGIFYKATCHCDKIQLSVKVTKKVINLWDCNCSDCNMRKNLHFVVPQEFVNIICGNLSTDCTLYEWGTKTAKRYFCKTCGILPFYIPRSNPNGFAITVACIDWSSPSVPVNLACFGKPKLVIKKYDGLNWEKSLTATNISAETA